MAHIRNWPSIHSLARLRCDRSAQPRTSGDMRRHIGSSGRETVEFSCEKSWRCSKNLIGETQLGDFFLSRRISAWSALDTPGRTPASISERRIRLRRVSAPTVNCEATTWVAAHFASWSSSNSVTRRTARSQKSFDYCVGIVPTSNKYRN